MSMACVYKYNIKIWNECEEADCIECGIAFGKTFSEVVRYLEDYYGEENIEAINSLTAYDVGGEYVLPESSFKSLGYKLSKKE